MIHANTPANPNFGYFHRFSDSLAHRFNTPTRAEDSRTQPTAYVVRQIPNPGLVQGPVGINLDVSA